MTEGVDDWLKFADEFADVSVVLECAVDVNAEEFDGCFLDESSVVDVEIVCYCLWVEGCEGGLGSIWDRLLLWRYLMMLLMSC